MTTTSNLYRKALLVFASLTAMVVVGACSSSVGGAPAAQGAGAASPVVSTVPAAPTSISGGSVGGGGGGAQPSVVVPPVQAAPTSIEGGSSGGSQGGPTQHRGPVTTEVMTTQTTAAAAPLWPSDLCQVLRPADLPSKGKLDPGAPKNEKGYQCSYSYNNSAQIFTLVDEEGHMSAADPAGGATEIVSRTIAGRAGVEFRLHGADRTQCAVEFKAGADAAFVNYLGDSGDACPAVLKIAAAIASRLPAANY